MENFTLVDLEGHRDKSITLRDLKSPCEELKQNLLRFWCKIMHEELKLWSSQRLKKKNLRRFCEPATL